MDSTENTGAAETQQEMEPQSVPNAEPADSTAPEKPVRKRTAKPKEKAEPAQVPAEESNPELEQLRGQVQEFQRAMNKTAAEKILLAAGLEDSDYAGLIDLIAVDDEAVCTGLATGIADLVKAKVENARREEREKLMSETPQPPSGDTAEAASEEDTLAQILGRRAAERNSHTEDVLKNYRRA